MQKLTTLFPQNCGGRLKTFYTTIDPNVGLTLQVNGHNNFGADVSNGVRF
jgi:hypothetical protein